MKTKMWEVDFGDPDRRDYVEYRLCVVAQNVESAIKKALKTGVEWNQGKMKNISKVELIAVED